MCSEPPSATLIICEPRQMPSTGRPAGSAAFRSPSLELVPLRIDAHVGQNLAAVDLGADIVAAADHEGRAAAPSDSGNPGDEANRRAPTRESASRCMR